MSYPMALKAERFFIAAEHSQSAAAALEERFRPHIRPRASLVEAFAALQIEVRTSDRGDIAGITMTSEAVEHVPDVLSAVAPFVASGSYVHLYDDEGDHYRVVFQNGECDLQQGRICWDGADPEVVPAASEPVIREEELVL